MNVATMHQLAEDSSSPAASQQDMNKEMWNRLESSNRNNTLTGLIRLIETGLEEVISDRKKIQEVASEESKQETVKLENIQSNVWQLRSMIMSSITNIFDNMYPILLPIKQEHRTNHTVHSDRPSSSNSSSPPAPISEFELDQGRIHNAPINVLTVSQHNMSHHQHIYKTEEPTSPYFIESEEEDNEKSRVQRMRDNQEITPFSLQEKQNAIMRIEDDADVGELNDLICYQQELGINVKRIRHGPFLEENHTSRTSEFSPIEERPIDEEYSVQKTMQRSEANVSFCPNRIPSQTNTSKPPVTKKLFSYNGQVQLKRMSTKKFQYLEQIN